jgi:hypothetical protein
MFAAGNLLIVTLRYYAWWFLAQSGHAFCAAECPLFAPGREVGRTISMHDTLLFHWGVTISCASKSWTYIVWKALAVIRKLEVAFSRKASTMTRRRERSLPKAQNPSNAQVQNWSFA